jgi:hypothetical protein
MRQWHARFEETMPDAHREFLESLGLDAAEPAHPRGVEGPLARHPPRSRPGLRISRPSSDARSGEFAGYDDGP